MKTGFGKKSFVWLAVVGLLVAALGVGWSFWGSGQKTGRQFFPVTAEVKRGDLEVVVTGTGTVEPAVEEEVRSRMNGTIESINMEEGQSVEEGDPLAQLEIEDVSLQIEKARINLILQEKELEELRAEKTREVITAPGDGKITWYVEEGDRVQEDSVIASLQEQDTFEAVGKFNSAQLEKIKPGQQAELLLLDFFVSVPAVVTDISNSGNPGNDGSVLYDVTVKFDNPGAVKEGMAGQLTILTSDSPQISVGNVTTRLPDPQEIRAPISGTLISVTDGADSGDLVEKGQILAVVDDSDRQEELDSQIVTAELKLKELQLELEELQEQQFERNEKGTITAPITGTLVLPDKPYGVGDDISQGTVLATVVDYTSLKVVIPVDELDVEKVKPGQEVRISADALPDAVIKGKVVSIASEGISQGGVATFDATVSMEYVEGLKVGMTVNAEIIVDFHPDTLLVPIEAVQEQNGQNVVMVVEQEKGGTAPSTSPVPVITGAYDTDYIQILDGLEEGQAVVLQSAVGESVEEERNVMMMPGGMGPVGRGMDNPGRTQRQGVSR